MTIALVKVSCINDRLIPLGLACLQAYLKQNLIPVQVFNFRCTNYTLPKVVFEQKKKIDALIRGLLPGGKTKDNFDSRISKYPSHRANLLKDLFDMSLKYIFKDKKDLRDFNSNKFFKIIFGDPWLWSHVWLSGKKHSQARINQIELFMILFNIFRLDAQQLRNSFGKTRKYTKNSVNDFKLECYSIVKKFFFQNPYSQKYISTYRNTQDSLYVGVKYFESEFDLLWSVWYAYVEWYVSQNSDILNNMFEPESPFRKVFGTLSFFKNFIGHPTNMFTNLRSGSYTSKRYTLDMENKLTLMSKDRRRSSFPNLHAIDNALAEIQNYLKVRYPKGSKIFHSDFFINEILGESTLLPKIYKTLLKLEYRLDGTYPFSRALFEFNHPNDYQRCSNFKIKVGTIVADYSQFINDRFVSKFSDLKNDKILSINSINGKNSPKPILDLLKLVKSFNGLYPLNFKNPSHPAIIKMAKTKLSDYVLATELPIWRKVGDKLVTGHIDIVLLIGDTLFVCDYKPRENSDADTGAFSKSFIMSLPQVAAYSKLHKSQYGIKKIYCVSFNEKGEAWIYQDNVLNSLESLLISKGYASWLIWKDYIV